MSDITDVEKYDRVTREVRLLRVASEPSSVRGRKWRWDVARYYTDSAGKRIHITRDFGYTRTRRGALHQIGLKVAR